MKLTEEELQAIECIEVYKTGHIVIVRESGLIDTDFSTAVVRWDSEHSWKTEIVERIWLSPEGFDEILWGMRIPDHTGDSKVAPSSFVRAHKRITESKKHGVIVLENL